MLDYGCKQFYLVNTGENMSDEYNKNDELNVSENPETTKDKHKITDAEKEIKKSSRRTDSSKSNGKKPFRLLLRVLILVVLFCVVVFAGIIISDLFFGDDSSEVEPEIIAITVSGKSIILNDDHEVTFKELKTYLDKADSRGRLVTVALINDTGNPADIELYNQIVDLLSEYGIICEKMTAPSTEDEVHTTNLYELPAETVVTTAA